MKGSKAFLLVGLPLFWITTGLAAWYFRGMEISAFLIVLGVIFNFAVTVMIQIIAEGIRGTGMTDVAVSAYIVVANVAFWDLSVLLAYYCAGEIGRYRRYRRRRRLGRH